MIDGSTRICGLLGYPVAHSYSPAMHNAAFQTLGINWVYLPLPVAAQCLATAVAALRAFNLAGVNVTVPYKKAVLPLVDELTTAAKNIGAVNVIVNRAGKLTGDNTDGAGFIRGLEAEANFTIAGKEAVVLGAGGAARAVAVQLALTGVKHLTILNRTPTKGEQIVSKIKKLGVDAKIMLWNEPNWRQAIKAADLVVQASSVGMHPNTQQCLPVKASDFRRDQVVCDLIYNPSQTIFLQRAALAGAQTFNGLGMLLYQGVLAFELWTDRSAPVELMRQVLLQKMEGEIC